MNLEPIGIVAVMVGIAMLYLPLQAVGAAFAISTLLGAAAAITLPSLGGSSITPAHLMLGFFILSMLLRLDSSKDGTSALDIGKPGFWLLLTTVWCLFSAVVMPRLFAGETYVAVPERIVSAITGTASYIARKPLAPTSGNITQSIYFAGDIACFLAAYVFVRKPGGNRSLTAAILAAGIGNLFFGFVDLATYHTGTVELLSPIRNAGYRMLDDSEIGGLKRIVGSFTEASTFAGTTIAYLVFSINLWREGVRPRLSGTVAAGSLLAVLFATSSTGYAVLAAYGAILYATCAYEASRGPVTRQTMVIVLGFPIVAVLVIGLAASNDAVWTAVTGIAEKTVGSEKLVSNSGIERAMWNAQALTNIVDSYGLGIGIGSTRASSLLIIMPAAFGVVGTACFLMFLVGIFSTVTRGATAANAARRAAKQTCMAMIIAGCVSGAQVDPGLPFMIFAALVCGPPQSPVSVQRRQPLSVAFTGAT